MVFIRARYRFIRLKSPTRIFFKTEALACLNVCPSASLDALFSSSAHLFPLVLEVGSSSTSCRLHSSEYCCSYLGTIEECIRLDFMSESSECERRFSEQPSNIIKEAL